MRGQKLTIILTASVVLMSCLVISVANPVPRTVRGYVYINGVITKPDKVTLSIGSQQLTATLFNNGYYIIDFSEEDGETGTFTVTVDGNDYPAPQTVTLLKNVCIYKVNLTVDVPTINHPPYKPMNPSPEDGAVDVPITTTLSVDVYDPDGDVLDVYFYWQNGTLIGIDSNVPSGGTATTGLLSLSYDTCYSWYAVANDSHLENSSSVWSFTTESAPSQNHPPYKPTNPSPENGSVNIPVDANLSWQCSDPDGDPLTFDVYFGTTASPPKVSTNQSSTLYNPGALTYSTAYYWKIVAWDNRGGRNESELWHFTTESYTNHPPATPYNPSPENGSMDISVDTTLSWHCYDPDGDSITYDVYFGATIPLPKVSANQSSSSYEPDTLNHSTTYYWRIVAWDQHGAKTAGPLWNFKTEAPVNHPPNKPTDPSPANNSENISINPQLSVRVSDPDGDSMDVYFYNAFDNSLIGSVSNVSNGSMATVYWSGLDYNRTYSWYAVANDSEYETRSDTWSFRTIEKEQYPPSVEITKPRNAIYFRDKQIIRFLFPIIIGPITIEVNATDSDGVIEKVEFFIDNQSRYNDTTEPYSWLWNEKIFGFHTIKVVAYDNDGRATDASTRVLIINFHIWRV